jgi:hypothetical protein
MRNWNELKDRRAATIVFRNFMERPENAQLKKTCCDSPEEAKRQFATLGEFYLEGETLPNQPPPPANVADIQIPRSVQFKIYDARDPKRHDLALLVLPSQWGDRSNEAADIFIAAWPQWGSIENEIAGLAARLNMLGQELAQRV